MLDTTKIGDSIHAHRKRAGLTQRKLGELARIGISNISSYENGKIPCLYNAIAIADALRVSLDDLIGRVVMDCPTLTPPNEPLTLDQLCKIEGKKVLIYRMKSTEPLEPGIVKMNGDVLGDNGTLAYHELYLLTWVAFSYPTAYLDREAWTSEWINSIPSLGAGDLETRCKSCGNLVLFETDFCPYCGKAMTEEAWAELEKRMEGLSHVPLSQQNQAADPQR